MMMKNLFFIALIAVMAASAYSEEYCCLDPYFCEGFNDYNSMLSSCKGELSSYSCSHFSNINYCASYCQKDGQEYTVFDVNDCEDGIYFFRQASEVHIDFGCLIGSDPIIIEDCEAEEGAGCEYGVKKINCVDNGLGQGEWEDPEDVSCVCENCTLNEMRITSVECDTGLDGICSVGREGRLCVDDGTGNTTWVDRCFNVTLPNQYDEDCDTADIDEDCDGFPLTDCPCQEDTIECGTDEGICEKGTMVCPPSGVWGNDWGECSAEIMPDDYEEDCTTLDDEDCDGFAGSLDPDCAEGSTCTNEGEVQLRDCNINAFAPCDEGNRDWNCTDIEGNLEWHPITDCSPIYTAAAHEDCDSPGDEDCDGLENDADPDCRACQTPGETITGEDCETGLEGQCGDGKRNKTCSDEYVWEYTACQQLYSEEEEICDDEDNDCDGNIDEGCDCVPGEVDTKNCGTNVGECTKGTKTRTCPDDGVWPDENIYTECTGKGPVQEICDDYKDNDCDGRTDSRDLDCMDGENTQEGPGTGTLAASGSNSTFVGWDIGNGGSGGTGSSGNSGDGDGGNQSSSNTGGSNGQNNGTTGDSNDNEQNNNSGNKMMWFLIIMILIGLMFGGGVFVYSNREELMKNDNVKKIAGMLGIKEKEPPQKPVQMPPKRVVITRKAPDGRQKNLVAQYENYLKKRGKPDPAYEQRLMQQGVSKYDIEQARRKLKRNDLMKEFD